jgi:hypothetical protein
MNALRLALLAAVLGPAVAVGGDPAPLVCTPQPLACEPSAASRVDPQLQRLLVERQLQAQPERWTAVYFYLPVLDERELLELQIRYLEELLLREKAKAKRLSAEE